MSGVLQTHTGFKFVKETPASDKGTRGRRLLRHSRPVCRSRESEESKRWKASSRVRIGFRLSCHSKAFQKSRTAAEGVSVSSGVAPWIPAKAGMTTRGAGMMGREREMTAWRSGPLIQNGVNGNLPLNPVAKVGQPGWQATEGLSPQPCHSAALGHGASPPHSYPKLGLT